MQQIRSVLDHYPHELDRLAQNVGDVDESESTGYASTTWPIGRVQVNQLVSLLHVWRGGQNTSKRCSVASLRRSWSDRDESWPFDRSG